MSCSICGQESTPGAALCADCRAARKRAFAPTITQPLMEAMGARRSRSERLLKPNPKRAALDAAGDKARPEVGSQLLETPSPRRGLLPVILIGVVLMLVAGAYGAHRMKSADAADAHAGPDAKSAPAIAVSPPAVAAPAATPPAPVAPVATVAPAAPTVTSAGEGSLPGSVVVPKKTPARPRPTAPAPVISLPTPDASPTVVVTARPPAPPPPVPVVRVDPLQALSDGLSRCSQEGFTSRLGCEQRIRGRYCEGQWGVSPQCPIGPNTDHGQ